MPRKPSKVSEEQKSLLASRLIKATGVVIETNRDCVRLASEIEEATNKRVSPSTLRRFFNLEFSPFNMSSYTIEVIEEYVLIRESVLTGNNELKNFILEIFSPHHYEDVSTLDTSMHAVYRKIAIILRLNEPLFLMVMEDLAKSRTGRNFYYELFPDYETLTMFQYKGYECYLRHSRSQNDIVFALSLLIKSANDRNDNYELNSYLNTLKSMEVDPKNLHPFVLGRYLSTLIRFTTSAAEKRFVLREVEARIQGCQPDKKIVFGQFPGFHYFVADALIDAGEVNLLKRVLKDAEMRYPRMREFEWKGYYDQFELFQAWYCFLRGNHRKAESILAGVNPNKFYFISSTYFIKRLNLLKNLLARSSWK